MQRIVKKTAVVTGAVLLVAALASAWYLHTKQPQRSGSVALFVTDRHAPTTSTL